MTLGVRRLLPILLSLSALLGTAVLSGPVGAATGATTDPRLSRGDCALTGRAWIEGRGCARRECVAGAKLAKTGYDAELCQRTGRGGAAYANPISERRCRQLHRVWLGQINSCAANPDRRRTIVEDAPQCRGRATVYLTYRETEGAYDECVTPERAAQLERIAAREGVRLTRAGLQRSRANCADRPRREMSDGVCVRRHGPPPTRDLGGLLLVGDSVSWRAQDELAARRGAWALDSLPGRRLDELAGRLDRFRADHGDPTALIVQLGTNRRRGFEEAEFRAVLSTVPASTPVMFLLPFRDPGTQNAALVESTMKYAAWMRTLAAERPLTCVADWASYAAVHLGHLVDGEHPDSSSEGWYARYVTRSWTGCESALPRRW